MTPPGESSGRRPYGAPRVHEIVEMYLAAAWLTQFIPDDALERLEAGEDPQRLADEVTGRIARHLGARLVPLDKRDSP